MITAKDRWHRSFHAYYHSRGEPEPPHKGFWTPAKPTNYYVYCLCETVWSEGGSGEKRGRFVPFYIGKGRGRRASSHATVVLAGRSTGNPQKDAVIRRIVDAGGVPTVFILSEHEDEQTAYAEESRWLEGRYKGYWPQIDALTNITPGQRTAKTKLREAYAAVDNAALHSVATKARDGVGFERIAAGHWLYKEFQLRKFDWNAEPGPTLLSFLKPLEMEYQRLNGTA